MAIIRHKDEIPMQPVPHGQDVYKQVLISAQEAPNFALRVFTIEVKGWMPLHTNRVEHEQFVLRGRARIRIGDDVVEVSAGDAIYIPAGVPHDYENIGDEPFEFICVVPNKPEDITTLL